MRGTNAETPEQQRTEVAEVLELRSIVVPTDFSFASKKSFDYAVEIGRQYAAKLYVMHVTSPSGGIPASLAADVRQLEREVAGAHHGFIVREGEVWEELEKFIEQARIDLVILGTRGRTGLKKLVLGSVAEQVFRHASCPVLTIGPNAASALEPEPKSGNAPILLAIDLGSSCKTALSWAVSLANHYAARLVLLHALSPAPSIEGPRWYSAADVVRAQNAAFSATLAQLEDMIANQNLVLQPVCMAEFGDPADRILWAADKLQAGLIVMGVHQKHQITASIAWSTAYEVVCGAPCPVLTVRSAH